MLINRWKAGRTDMTGEPVPTDVVDLAVQDAIDELVGEYGFELAAADAELGESLFGVTMEFAARDDIEAPLAAHTVVVGELAELLSADAVEANRNRLYFSWLIDDE